MLGFAKLTPTYEKNRNNSCYIVLVDSSILMEELSDDAGSNPVCQDRLTAAGT